MTLLLALAAAAAPVFEDASDRLAPAVVRGIETGGSGYSGAAFLDADQDGWLDVVLANGPGDPARFFRNLGGGQLAETTREVGLDADQGTRGVLAADLSGDGFPELVLTGDLRAPVKVFWNRGDGTFEDRSASSGLVGSARNQSAHAADVDGDGDLDVVLTGGALPEGVFPNRLYLNLGGGLFQEVPEAFGPPQGACAAGFGYLNADDHPDFLVANCAQMGELTPIETWLGHGDGRFEDGYGATRTWALGHWMGLAWLDLGQDLRADFFLTNGGNTRSQPHALYQQTEDGTFREVGAAAGVADAEFGWGAVSGDFDLDGWEDLYYVGRSQAGDWCGTPGHLFLQRPDASFHPPVQPIDLRDSWTSGLAVGDLDGNGALDLLVQRSEVQREGASGAPVLLLNQAVGSWLVVRARQPGPNPLAVGARVVASLPGQDLLRTLEAGSSFLSTNAPDAHFGLGASTEADLCVVWPGGEREAFGRFAAGQVVPLTRGEGRLVPACPAPPPSTTDTGAPGGTAPEPGSGVDTAEGASPPTSARPKRDARPAPAPGRCQTGGSKLPFAPWVALFLIRRRR